MTKRKPKDALLEARQKCTDKQRLFSEYYAVHCNATRAAREAGYKGSESTLGVTGFDNIRKPKVRKYIDELLKVRHMSAEEVVYKLTQHANGSLEDFLETGDLEGVNTINLAKARRADKLHLLQEVKVTHGKNSNGISIRLHSQQGALDKLAKYHGLYQERVDLTTGGQPFDLEAWDKTRTKRRADVEAMDDENQ